MFPGGSFAAAFTLYLLVLPSSADRAFVRPPRSPYLPGGQTGHSPAPRGNPYLPEVQFKHLSARLCKSGRPIVAQVFADGAVFAAALARLSLVLPSSTDRHPPSRGSIFAEVQFKHLSARLYKSGEDPSSLKYLPMVQFLQLLWPT